jgi:hypothetical protein
MLRGVGVRRLALVVEEQQRLLSCCRRAELQGKQWNTACSSLCFSPPLCCLRIFRSLISCIHLQSHLRPSTPNCPLFSSIVSTRVSCVAPAEPPLEGGSGVEVRMVGWLGVMDHGSGCAVARVAVLRGRVRPHGRCPCSARGKGDDGRGRMGTAGKSAVDCGPLLITSHLCPLLLLLW